MFLFMLCSIEKATFCVFCLWVCRADVRLAQQIAGAHGVSKNAALSIEGKEIGKQGWRQTDTNKKQ